MAHHPRRVISMGVILETLDRLEACARLAASGRMRGVFGGAQLKLRRCADEAEAILRRVGRRV